MRLKFRQSHKRKATIMLARGETRADVARHYDISVPTLYAQIKLADVQAMIARQAQRKAEGKPQLWAPPIERQEVVRKKLGRPRNLTPKVKPAPKKSGPVSKLLPKDRYIATVLLLKGMKRDEVAAKYKISNRYLTEIIPGKLLDEYRRDGLPAFEDIAPAGATPPTALEMIALERMQPRLSKNLQESFNHLSLLAVPLHAASAVLPPDAQLTQRGITSDMLWQGFLTLNEKLYARYNQADAAHDMKTTLWQRYGLHGYTPEHLQQSREEFIRRSAHEVMGDGNASLRRDVMLIVRPGDKAVLGELWLSSRNRNPLAGAIPTLLLDPAIKSVTKIKEQFVLLACKTAAQRAFPALVVEAYPQEAGPSQQVLLSPVDALTRMKAKSLLRAEVEAHPLLPRTRSQQRTAPCYRIDLAPFVI